MIYLWAARASTRFSTAGNKTDPPSSLVSRLGLAVRRYKARKQKTEDCGSELRSCVKVEVAVLGSPS